MVDEEEITLEERAGWPDAAEWAMFVGLAVISMAVLGPLLFKGRQLTGSDGLFPPDQLQYLTWIRQASKHWLIGNEFDFRTDHRVFLHPGFLLSGLLHRWTGVSLQTSYLALWKPVAVVITFIGCRQYVRRLVPGRAAAHGALFCVLFVVMPWSAMFKQLGSGPQRMYTFDFISGELWTGQMLLGYMMTAVAVCTMPLVLLGVERFRGGPTDLRGLVVLTASAAGAAIVMWLQPWQGAELLIIVCGVELWRRLRNGVELDWRLLVVVCIGALPAVYYAWLGSADASWRLASHANQAGAQPLWSWPIWAIALTLGPLAIPAAFAFRGPVANWQSTAVRIWPVAVLAVYLQPFGTFPYHSVQGLMLPMSVLAAQGLTTRWPAGWPKVRWWMVVPVLVALTVPGTLHKLSLVRNNIHGVAYPYYVFGGEDRALRFLESSPIPGGVLTDTYGGLMVPALAGRESYIGPFSWTPSWDVRANITGTFFAGKLGPVSAQRFVRGTGARFVFQECKGRVQPPISLAADLGPLVQSTHDFGCARVYVLKPWGREQRVSARIGAAE